MSGAITTTDWEDVLNKPSGLVSSSTQVDYTQLQNLPSASGTASYVEYVNVANKPTLVSSSTQIELDQISGATFAASNFTFPQDLVVGGILSADKLLVSSSVIYESGSTKFGDSAEDTHQFTGSVFVYGNVTADNFYGTASIAENITLINAGFYDTGSDSYIIPTPSGGLSYVTSASHALTASYALSVENIIAEWNSILNKPPGLISSSTQVYTHMATMPNNSLVGDSANSLIGGSPIEIDYGITKGDLANRFTGIKVYNYDWSGGNLAGQVEIWTDSEAQDFSTRRFYIDGFGNTEFNSQVYVTGSVTTTGNVIANNYVQTPLLYNGGPIEIRSYYLPLQINSNGAGIILNDNVQVTGSLTVSGSSTFRNIGPTVLSGSIFFEEGSTIVPNSDISGGINIVAGPNAYAQLTSNNGDSYVWVDNDGAYIGTAWTTTPHEWIFDKNGKLTAPSIIQAPSFTGSLFGTSSWANKVVTASYALNAPATLPDGVVSSSGQISYTGLSNIPIGLISSSTQVQYGSITNVPTGIVSSSGQVNYGGLSNIPIGIVSSSQLLAYATTGSNTFTGIETISNTTNSTLFSNGALVVQGGVGIAKDVNISGSLNVIGLLTAISQSVQYVTSSQLIVADNKIAVNTNDLTRFGGLSVYDSGSASPTTASIYWDSLNHKFVYENISGSDYGSAIFIGGPKNYGTLGNEVGLVDYRVPVAHGDDHIDNRVQSSSIRVDFPSRLTHIEAGLYVTGAIQLSDGITGSLSYNNLVNVPAGILSSSAQINLLSGVSASYVTTSSYAVSSSAAARAVSSSYATTASYANLNSSYLWQMADVNDYTATTIADGFQLAWNSGSQQWAPAAGAAAKGVVRLFVSAKRSNANAFYFNAITVTADASATPSATSAFLITTTLLSKVTVYLRADGSAGNTLVQINKNANGSPFADATSSIASSSQALTVNTVGTYTFSGLTLNQFDSIHIYCSPTSNPGQMYGIVTIE